MRRKIAGTILFSLVFLVSSGISGSVVAQQEIVTAEFKDLAWTTGHTEFIDQLLVDKLFTPCLKSGNALRGIGLNDTDVVDNSNYWTFENLVSLAALSARGSISSDSQARSMAVENVWDRVKNYTENLGADAKSTAVFGFVNTSASVGLNAPKETYLQGAALEFLSTFYRFYEDEDLKFVLRTLLDELQYYQSNSTGIGDVRAFWTTIGGKHLGAGINMSHYLDTKTNLWVAAGIANAYQVFRAKDLAINSTFLERAESAMAFLDSERWDGTFYVDFAGMPGGYYSLGTQALAILACARLYSATHKALYLSRAQLLLDNLDQIFFISGLGGYLTMYNSTVIFEREQGIALMQGSSNSMLAYAVIELYGASGNVDHLGLAEVIMNFMWNKLRFESSSKLYDGFVEFCQNGPGKTAYQYDPEYSAKTRLIKTNAWVLYTNEQIAYHNRSFWQKYMWYFIYGGIGFVALIFVIWLIGRLRGGGSVKVPKVVKGLLED